MYPSYKKKGKYQKEIKTKQYKGKKNTKLKYNKKNTKRKYIIINSFLEDKLKVKVKTAYIFLFVFSQKSFLPFLIYKEKKKNFL